MRADINILEFSVMILAIIAGILFHICVWIFMVPIRTLRSLFMLLGNVRDELEAFAAVRIPARVRDEETEIGDDGMDVSEGTIVELKEAVTLSMSGDEKAVGNKRVCINGTGSSWAQGDRIRRSGFEGNIWVNT
jgi:hypothetical protein